MVTWHSQAACRGLDTNLFFPGKGDPLKPAKAVCARCPVATECLEEGLRPFQYGYIPKGIWGGKSERERERIIGLRGGITPPELSAAPHGTHARYMSHRRAGETPCQACREAHSLVRAMQKERRAG